MQKNKQLEEGMELFLMPTEALKVAGFEDGERLVISATEGKISIERAEYDEDFDEEYPICPCCAKRGSERGGA